MSKNYDAVKREIIRKFDRNIKGRTPIFLSSDDSNAGKEGDWLTRKMGLSKNGLNEPDYKGFEMKKHSSKITFGDWSPDEALYKSELSKKDFLAFFGIFGTASFDCLVRTRIPPTRILPTRILQTRIPPTRIPPTRIRSADSVR